MNARAETEEDEKKAPNAKAKTVKKVIKKPTRRSTRTRKSTSSAAMDTM